MALFTDSIKSFKNGYHKFYKAIIEQKERGILSGIIVETIDGQDVLNIVGSLEIRPEFLNEGKLPVKIGNLSGDLILYTRDYDESILPNQMGGDIIFKVNEPTEVNEGDEHPEICSKQIDWEERHFQICLALLSRTDLHSFHSNTVSTVDPKLPAIIKTADRMVELLKEHNSKANNED